jgi:CBS domain-containing protein
MQARDLMTTEVVAAAPDMTVREVARLLLRNQVSAVPVVDAAGAVVGMVSEGDLVGRSEAEREARRDWWLAMIAEGEELHPDFLASLRRPERTAREVMSAPVIGVSEATPAGEIAALLAQYRIKRVPVVRDGRLVGIVSRADLLRAMAGEAAPMPIARTRGLLAEALATLDHHFFGDREERGARAAKRALLPGGLSVGDFRSLVAAAARHKSETAAAAQREAAAQRSERVRQLIDEHMPDANWRALLQHAREAAERGEKEFLLLRFPSDLCADRGRAINAALSDWPRTLRGEAAEIYLRWEGELKPRGFHLMARVLDFPGGKPGDIGLFLAWGE